MGRKPKDENVPQTALDEKLKEIEKMAEYHKSYYKKYPWMSSFSHAKWRCINKKYDHYCNYGGKGVKFLLSKEDIKQLWFRDKAYKMKKPSIDRIDNDKNYEYRNCRFIELDINCVKDKIKPVLQYDLNGNFIKEWASLSEINKKFKYSIGNISSVCHKNRKSASGFLWRYKDEK